MFDMSGWACINRLLTDSLNSPFVMLIAFVESISGNMPPFCPVMWDYHLRIPVSAFLHFPNNAREGSQARGDNFHRVLGHFGLQHLVDVVGFAQMIVGFVCEDPAFVEGRLSCLIQGLAVEVV